MKKFNVYLTQPAADDLKGISDYIAHELREPSVARKLVGKIKKTVMSLAEMPTRHALVADEELALQGIRKLIMNNYIVFYVVSEEEATVTVIRILYGRRNWINLL